MPRSGFPPRNPWVIPEFSKGFSFPWHIEGCLSEPDVELVFEAGGEPDPVSPAMQVADAEVLLDDVSDLGDGLVTQDFRVGQLGGGGVFSQDAIRDVVEGEKAPVGLSGVALVGAVLDLVFQPRVR